MKKIGVVLSVCLLLIGTMFWQFRTREAIHETYYNRRIIGEYVGQQTQSLPVIPSSLVLAGKRLYAVSSLNAEVSVYDLQLRPITTLRFPSSMRVLLGFSVQGDTAYGLDGTQMLAALSLRTNQYKLHSLHNLRFSRLLPLPDAAYLLKGPDPAQAENDVFKVVGARAGTPTMIHRVIKQLGDYGMNSDGFFVQGQNGVSYCVSFFNSQIYTFDRTGSYLGALQTIGGANREYEVKKLGAYYTFGEPTRRLNIAGAADSLLYLYSRVRSTTPKTYPFEGYLDTYSTKSHAYAGSLRVRRSSSTGFNGLAVTGDTLLAAEGRRLVLYRKQVPQLPKNTGMSTASL